VLAYLTIAAELGLGLLIALGFYARAASVLLAGRGRRRRSSGGRR
jgi:putative oxidoreductase